MAELLARIDPFAARIAALSTEGDVRLMARPGLGIATVSARGPLLMLGGIALPQGPAVAIDGDTTAVGIGPGNWLVLRDGAPAAWIGALESELGDAACVADQSSAYAVMRLSGEAARRLLGRGAFIDFHPDSFRAGSAAVTLIAHMGAIVWQRDDTPTYEVAVFRSYLGSFWHWLESAAGSFGARLARIG